MTKTETKTAYLTYRLGYETALRQLEQLGMGAGAADDYLFEKDEIYAATRGAEEAEADRFCDDGQGPREDYSIGSGERDAND